MWELKMKGKCEVWTRWCVRKDPSSWSSHRLWKRQAPLHNVLEEEWEFTLPCPQLLIYTKHPVSSLPFHFPDFRSWQVSKLRNKCDWLWTARAASRLQVYGREGFPGFYWTIGEWLPLCWMGLKGWAVHSYFYNMNFNQTKWVVGWRKFFVKLYWKINMQT